MFNKILFIAIVIVSGSWQLCCSVVHNLALCSENNLNDLGDIKYTNLGKFVIMILKLLQVGICWQLCSFWTLKLLLRVT